jgi:hypothetical protein
MRFKLPGHTVKDVCRLLESARVVRVLTRTKDGFRKKLDSLLAEKGGMWRLMCYLNSLASFAEGLGDIPCVMDMEVHEVEGGKSEHT